MHQPRLAGQQRVGAEPELLLPPEQQVVDEHVGVGGEPPHQVLAPRPVEGDGDAALAAVVQVERRVELRHAVGHLRLTDHAAHGVAGQRFDLDDVVRISSRAQARGKGVGRALSRHGLVAGLELDLSKLVVEVVVDAVPAIGMFEALGFEPETLLRDHVRDKSGELRDLVVLAHLVDGTWSGMATAGFEEELA